ncbi:hypothetical protein F3J23_09215 [Chryseobacterium sp. Tr-659]|uniref:hypothetical protein n=1 Tax=Chryseobacterium sp. Tr-659 TaxID=2608340 RepID=UPI001421FF16|nr:hypothetical protein [Chryseobacterium sp. Tr-659]NIF05622.1 hypothetical protein [Chryseobacterium sp. Tr-659]
MKTKQELKQYFENGDIPKQEEFWEWQESYWHKDEKIPQDNIADLKESLKNKLTKPQLGTGFYIVGYNDDPYFIKINLQSYYLTSWNGSSFVSSNVYSDRGKIGIGTNMPTEILQVEGNIKSQGMILTNPQYIPAQSGNTTKILALKNDGTVGWTNQTSDTQNHIPLTGTADNSPLTGSIQYQGGDTTGYNSFGFYNKLSNNEKAGFDIQDDGSLSPHIYWIGTDNNKTMLRVYHDDVAIFSDSPSFSGLRGGSYYGDYYTNESYIQKQYADKQHSYTTKEERTGGKWINKKPVYKKTLFLDQIPRTGELPIDKIFEDVEVIVSNQMFTEWYAMDVAFAGNQWMTKAFITLENRKVRFELKGVTDYDYSLINSFTLTLEYTKKSDGPVYS